MRGEKFYEMLDLLDDNLVLESAEVKRKTWRRRLAILGIVVGILVLFWFFSSLPVLFPSDKVGDAEGCIQDGAYYVYAGSGVGINESRVPQGIVRYVPGQGKELLVSAEEHPMDVIFPCWGVNSHGLYYLDMKTDQLRRQDLATGEETVLYTAPDTIEGQQMPETELSGLLGSLLSGEEPVLDYGVGLFMNWVTEDQVCFSYRAGDGLTSYAITVDSRTGEILNQRLEKEGDEESTYLTIGDRKVQTVRMDYPEGVTYPGWEEDVAFNDFYWTDVQENGQSLLPPNSMGEARNISGALVVGYCEWQGQPRSQFTPTDYLLLTEEETLVLPAPPENEERTYLAYFDGWLYYQNRKTVVQSETRTQTENAFQATNLATGETVKLWDRLSGRALISDGTWCYVLATNRTDCYRLDRDDTGRPLTLTLVEENI